MDTSRYNNSKRNKRAVEVAYGSEMHIFSVSIPRSEAIAEIASEGISIFKYDKRSKGAESYEKTGAGGTKPWQEKLKRFS